MLHNTTLLYGRKLGATDGEIGQVKDFYFDDMTWKLRYIVADTGSWLTGRQVLLSHHAFGPEAFGRVAGATDPLRVNLTRKQIEDSPSTDAHRPISRQFEDEYHRYYGYATYWQEGGAWSGASFPVVLAPPLPAGRPHHGHNQRDDVHLRSTKSTTGYSLHATDGEIGSVSGYIVDGETWEIRELVVETGHWYAGKTIYVATKNITRVSYDHSSVFVNLTKENVTETPPHEVAQTDAKQH